MGEGNHFFKNFLTKKKLPLLAKMGEMGEVFSGLVILITIFWGKFGVFFTHG